MALRESLTSNRKCVFTPYTIDKVGLAYEEDPNCIDECCSTLQAVDNYINRQGDGGLASDLLNTINDLAEQSQTSYEPFYLLIPGYAQFWAVPSGDTDDCSDWAFAPWWVKTPHKISKPLRARMNELILSLNSVYSSTISGWRSPGGRNQHAIYVDIDSAFQGHRFCEAGASYNDQYYGDAVYFWNLMFTVSREAEWSGSNLTNCHEIPSGSDFVSIGKDMNNTLSTDDYGITGSGGVIGRTFHPTLWGHAGIAHNMIAALRNAGVPGVVNNDPILPTPWDKSVG